MNSNENKQIIIKNGGKLSKAEFDDGFKNWLFIMVSIFAAYLMLDNYMRFGLIKGPFEIAFCVINLILQHWWLICATIAYYFLQIAQTFLVEKLLAVGLVSEKVGMSLHALNVFFLPTAFTITSHRGVANPIVARFLATYILYAMTKVWSYAYINSRFRNAYEQKMKKTQNDYDKQLITYPHNITVENIIEYFVFTPPVQYKISYPERTAPNWKALAKLCVQLFLVYYIIAFSLIQFLLPELSALKNASDDHIHTLRCILRIALPTNLLWMLSIYVHVYKIYLPAYAALTGMEHVVFCKDWWNSESFNLFWRKWNLPVHECFKYNVALPLLRSGYSATMINLVIFAIAGIIHEYLNTFPFGIYNGLAFFCTLMEIPVGYISTHLTKKFGGHCGNCFVWTYLILVLSLSIVHVSQSYNP